MYQTVESVGTHGVFMLSENDPDLDKLAEQFFVGELGLSPEEVPEAARNLLGAFETLLKIDERLKKEICSTVSH